MKIIIIGGGIAAAEAASAARKQSPDAVITVYSAETEYPYRRPALSSLVANSATPAGFLVKSADFYAANSIGFFTGSAVTAIDTVKRTVTLANGTSDTFDRLIIATGAQCRKLPIPGMELEQVFSLRDLDDLDRINRRIAAGVKNAVILGGGILGLETAESMLDGGISEVVIVERSGHLLTRQMDREAADFLQKSLERPGLRIITGASAAGITEKSVTLDNGMEIAADLVLVSAGAVADTALAAAAGIKVHHGIVTDSTMQSSVPGIYAAGDVAEVIDRCYGTYMPARDMGQVAGTNAAGGDARFTAAFQPFRAVLSGVKIFSAGDLSGEGRTTVDDRGNFRREFFNRDGELTGGVLIGDVSGAMKLQNALKG